MTQGTYVPEALSHPVFKIISDCASALGVRAFVIGGFVRDHFLGRRTDDIDIVVEGSGIALAQAVAAHAEEELGHPCHVSVFKNFGTAMLRYKGTEVEFVGARKESYRLDSRKPIVEDGTLEDDQRRRDFTINAMAFSLQREDYGMLVDPFHGIQDLAQGLIRTPLDPAETFSDDPLRMFRAVRFASKLSTPEVTFRIVPEAIEAMSRMKDRVDILSRERISEELSKTLVCDHPSIALRTLSETGILAKVLPDLEKLRGVETVDGKGHKDNFNHTLKVVDNVAALEKKAISEGRLYNYTPHEDGNGWDRTPRTEPYVWLRWAALLHDIGKHARKRWDEHLGWTFHGHDIVGSRMVPRIFSSLKMPLNEKMKYVQKLVLLHHRPVALVDEGVTDSAVRRLIFDAGNELDDLMLLCNADITSKNPAKVARIRSNFELVQEKIRDVEAKDAIRNWKNPITGDYVMEVFGIEPCNTIGEIKERVKNAILDGEIPNTFEDADAFMRKIAPEYGLVEKK